VFAIRNGGEGDIKQFSKSWDETAKVAKVAKWMQISQCFLGVLASLAVQVKWAAKKPRSLMHHIG
jgi:hypothetical protein